LLDAGNSRPADSEDDVSVCDDCSTDATPTEPFMYKKIEATSRGGARTFAEDANLEDGAVVFGSPHHPEPKRAKPVVEGESVHISPWADTGVMEGPRLQLWDTKPARRQEESGLRCTDGSEDCENDSDSDVVMGNADSS